jgi:hypothetical protein
MPEPESVASNGMRPVLMYSCMAPPSVATCARAAAVPTADDQTSRPEGVDRCCDRGEADVVMPVQIPPSVGVTRRCVSCNGAGCRLPPPQ